MRGQKEKPSRRLSLRSRRTGRILGAKLQAGISPRPEFSCWLVFPGRHTRGGWTDDSRTQR